MSRHRKKSRKQGMYFLYCPVRKMWVNNLGENQPPGYRYCKNFYKAVHFRNFTRANRFRRNSEEVRKLVCKLWIFYITRKVKHKND